MNILTHIARRNGTRTTNRQPRTARPGLETMETRTMLSMATFRVIGGDLYEKQGSRQSLVATHVLSLEVANRRTIIFAEQNGNVFEKTVTGRPKLIHAGPPAPAPTPTPSPTQPTILTITPTPAPTPTPLPSPMPPQGDDWFTENLANAGIGNLARAEYHRDGSITFGDMEGIFDEILQDGSVTSSEVNDVQVLVSSAAELNMPSYVATLASKVVNPTSADVSYLDAYYSNVPPMPMLKALENQWFKGTVQPNAVDTVDGSPVDPNNTYTVPGATGYTLLGANGPAFTDVAQGVAGDCWFLASLAETAARDSDAIKNMFADNGDGTWTVRFFANGQADYVTVNDQLPLDTVYGGFANDRPLNGVLWVALAEKAFAEENLSGQISTAEPGSDSYAALSGGYPKVALAAITGVTTSEYNVTAGSTSQSIAAAMQQGELVCMITPENSNINPNLVGGHCYAVVGYDPSSPVPFEVFNPWGMQSFSTSQKWGLLHADGEFLEENFVGWGETGSSASESGSSSAKVPPSSVAVVTLHNVDLSAAITSLGESSEPVIRASVSTTGRPSHSSSGQRTGSLPGRPVSRTKAIVYGTPSPRQLGMVVDPRSKGLDFGAIDELSLAIAQEQ